jgi:hypothetical protein
MNTIFQTMVSQHQRCGEASNLYLTRRRKQSGKKLYEEAAWSVQKLLGGNVCEGLACTIPIILRGQASGDIAGMIIQAQTTFIRISAS